MNVCEPWLELSEDVLEARRCGVPVVALESCVWAQGLPRPINLEAASATCRAVRENGAVPAIIAILNGKVKVGLSPEELSFLCKTKGFVKVGSGDILGAMALKQNGATTVSASVMIAEKAGLKFFATGGLGGVHMHWNSHLDVSADLVQLERCKCLVVCSGVKSVLDIRTTMEVFELLSIPLVLYKTDLFPRFFAEGIKIGIGFRLDTPEDVCRTYDMCVNSMGRGLTLANPLPLDKQISAEEMDELIESGVRAAENDRITGKALTPYLLDHLVRESHGKTLEANCDLLVNNAALAANLASVWYSSHKEDNNK